MICRYRFELTSETGKDLPFSTAYKLYAWLMGRLPSEFADQLHEQGETPLSQSVRRGAEQGSALWELNLLNLQMAELLRECLFGLSRIELHGDSLTVKPLSYTEYRTPEAFIADARAKNYPYRVRFNLNTPVSFKQNGGYVLFPQEKLFLNSLLTKWNVAFPEYPLNDPDAVAMLEAGLRISDYDLHSSRYVIKKVGLPCFYGNFIMEAKLAAPLLEIWNLLLCFASFSGVGVKAALGMGSVEVTPAVERERTKGQNAQKTFENCLNSLCFPRAP